MDFGRAQAQLVGVMIARRDDSAQYVPQFRIVIDETQQRLALSACLADSEDVFGGRIQADDQEVLVEQDNARAKAVEYVSGVVTMRSVVAGAAGRFGAVVA